MQVLEHSLSSVCNLAAGNQQAKQALCEAGAIEPLLGILVNCIDRSLAQLAALALRNLSRSAACREEIVRLDGVAALLEFLSEGLSDLHYSFDCQVRICCRLASKLACSARYALVVCALSVSVCYSITSTRDTFAHSGATCTQHVVPHIDVAVGMC